MYSSGNVVDNLRPGAKILFASFPGDGHFNPMTGLAFHLKNRGYDVRFYTGSNYREKIESLGIPFLPFEKAMELDTNRMDELFPERASHKSLIAKLNYDIINVFIKQGPAYFEDLQAIQNHFPFELLVADVAFSGIPWVKDIMKIPIVGVGVFPVTKNSKDLPPSGMGMLPSYTYFGKLKQNLLRWAAKNILFARSNKVMKEVLAADGIDYNADMVFDLMPEKCNIILQTGTPGFEYKRCDLPLNYKFVGPLLPVTKKTESHWYDERLSRYKKIVLATQGTVEKDNTKLLVPTLEAFKNTDYLVVITTGGSDTEKLRSQYAAPNVIIEDFIPFADIMPYANVYVTNGGMGGVQLSIQNKLPMVTGGLHEGKNEICARVGYFNLGINLKTERPSAAQIRKAVEQVVSDDSFRKNAEALCREFKLYHPGELCEKYVQQLLPKRKIVETSAAKASIY